MPLVIDTTDPEVLELALKYTQGKAIINSVNLEDGLEKFENVVPLVHRYGASLVVGTIDERGQAITREDKLEVAQRSYDILVNDFGIEPENIIFDPLVFPVGTGDEQYIGSAKETIEGIRLIKEAMPRCQSILGVSNISFGLPEAGREVLNSVFLYECTKADSTTRLSTRRSWSDMLPYRSMSGSCPRRFSTRRMTRRLPSSWPRSATGQ